MANELVDMCLSRFHPYKNAARSRRKLRDKRAGPKRGKSCLPRVAGVREWSPDRDTKHSPRTFHNFTKSDSTGVRKRPVTKREMETLEG